MLTPLTQDRWSCQLADHLYHRAGFGGSPAERESFYQLGKSQGVLAAVDSLVTPSETWENLPKPSWSTEIDPNGDLWEGESERRRSFIEWYMKMLREGEPLAAKLLKFLLDHLPIDMGTCSRETRFMYFIRFFEMLRRHAAGMGEDGNFRTLITEVSWSEAMIKMLDLDDSSAGEINENFGRELLELFTSFDYWRYATPNSESDDGWIGRYFSSQCSGCDATQAIEFASRTTTAFSSSQGVSPSVSFETPNGYGWRNLEAHGSDTPLEELYRKLIGLDHLVDDGVSPNSEALSYVPRSSHNAMISTRNVRDAIENGGNLQIEDWPNNRFSRDLQQVAQLILGGMDTSIYYVHQNGYDRTTIKMVAISIY